MALSSIEQTAINQLYNQVKNEFDVEKIILFGSKARGDDEKYSDIDLLILTKKEKTNSDRTKLSDIAAEINIDLGVALSCLYYNIYDWEQGEEINPFLKQNIEKEGIDLVLQ